MLAFTPALPAASGAVRLLWLLPVLPLLGTLRKALQAQSLIVSDRRWHRSLRALQAEAWLHGRAAVTPEDARILRHILWEDPDQRHTIDRLVLQTVAPLDATLADWLDDLRDAVQQALQTARNPDLRTSSGPKPS